MEESVNAKSKMTTAALVAALATKGAPDFMHPRAPKPVKPKFTDAELERIRACKKKSERRKLVAEITEGYARQRQAAVAMVGEDKADDYIRDTLAQMAVLRCKETR
jgi:hypothetical protein